MGRILPPPVLKYVNSIEKNNRNITKNSDYEPNRCDQSVRNVKNVRNVTNVMNVMNVRNDMNAAGEKAGEGQKR